MCARTHRMYACMYFPNSLMTNPISLDVKGRKFHLPDKMCPAREILCQASWHLRGLAGALNRGQLSYCKTKLTCCTAVSDLAYVLSRRCFKNAVQMCTSPPESLFASLFLPECTWLQAMKPANAVRPSLCKHCRSQRSIVNLGVCDPTGNSFVAGVVVKEAKG